MTRIYTDGAEFGDMLFWDLSAYSYTTTSPKRSGAYAYQIGGNGPYMHKNLPSAIDEGYIRLALYSDLANNSNGQFILFRNGSSDLVTLGINPTTRTFTAYVGGGGVSTSTRVYTTSTWALIEMWVKIADSGGRIVVKYDGETIIDYTGDTKPSTATTFDGIRIFAMNNSTQYYDDLAFNDTSGASDNSWCGDGHIEILTPNGNGDTNNWTGSDGDSTNNYLLVDDIPPNSDTDYVKSSTALQQDMYAMTDFTATGKIVARIFAEARAKDNDVSGGQIKLGFKTGGTVYLSSSARTLSGNYARVVGDEATVDPGDSNPWSDADLDAIQLVLECE